MKRAVAERWHLRGAASGLLREVPVPPASAGRAPSPRSSFRAPGVHPRGHRVGAGRGRWDSCASGWGGEREGWESGERLTAPACPGGELIKPQQVPGTPNPSGREAWPPGRERGFVRAKPRALRGDRVPDPISALRCLAGRESLLHLEGTFARDLDPVLFILILFRNGSRRVGSAFSPALLGLCSR